MHKHDRGMQGGETLATTSSEPPTRAGMTRTEIEVQFLLKEYEVLRAEMLAKQGFQVQFSNLAILLLGALVAAIPIALFSGTSSLPVSIPPSYVVTGLFIIALIFLSLLWAVMDEDIEVALHGNYYNKWIRARVGDLLGTSEPQTPVLNWDRFRMTMVLPHTPWQFLYYIGFAARGTARYGLYVIPAGIAMIVAVITYVENSPLPPTAILDWVNVALFGFDVLYIGSSVPFVSYISRLYKNMRVTTSDVHIG